jgi:2-iminoacetate synthase
MISEIQFQEIFSSSDRLLLKKLAEEAHWITQREFGRTISLYSPLYISNYCQNHCLYCGFSSDNQIARHQLSVPEMDREMNALHKEGFQSILILTGENKDKVSIKYLIQAVLAAKKYFSHITLEVFPLETEEYHRLYQAGADGITLYQETYQQDRYRLLHPSGKKADYHYRFHAPERMADAGIRQINLGVLLGLSQPIHDVFQLFLHLEELWKRYPGVEFGLSFPRLIPQGNFSFGYFQVTDIDLVKIICLARILFPKTGIILSTRENAFFRDRALELGVTRISAGSKTTVGGYWQPNESDGQFQVQDSRSLTEMVNQLKQLGFDPVFTYWRNIPAV